MTHDVTDLSLSNRVVLLGMTALALDDETPAQTPSVRRRCRTHATELEDVVVGTFDEATVARSLNELDAEDHLDRVEQGEPSAVGKGRPAFELASTPTDVLEVLDDDDPVAPVASTLLDTA